ncbi:hypothetical protein D3C78_1609430 [compost metagenome]
MAKTKRHLLARETCRARLGQKAGQQCQLGILVALAQHLFEFKLNIKIIFNHSLAAAGDKYKMLDARFRRLINDVLNDRLVDDGEHFFRNRLGGGQETCTETCDRKYSLPNFLLFYHISLLRDKT